MTFRSEHNTSYCVRASLTFHMACLASVCYDCFVFTVSSPLISGRPCCCRRLHHCRDRLLRRRTYRDRRASRQAEPFSSPDIACLSVLSCTRHCYCCCYDYNPIQLHNLFLSPLDVPSFNPMLPIITYALFSSKPCALLARFRIEGRDHFGSDRGNDILQLQQVRINADALGNLQRRDSAESLRV